jgi:hypothetical protein
VPASDLLFLICRCGAKYSNRAGADSAHHRVFGHWPIEARLVGEEVILMPRCDSCGGPINPQTGECRCSD